MTSFSLSSMRAGFGALGLAAALVVAALFAAETLRSRASNEALVRRLRGLEERRAGLAIDERRRAGERRALAEDPFAVERRLREQIGRSQPGEILLEK